MATKKKAGRPKSANPLIPLRVRITPEIRKAIEEYKAKYADQAELRDVSDTVRYLLGRTLRQEGLMK